MRIVTYLGFTLLSIFIQFSIIDFIQGRLKLDEKPIDGKGTSQKRQLRDVLKDISDNKPHALYYRTQASKGIKNHIPAKLISNISITELFATTDITTSAIFDILYDENVTTTETDETYTTESLYTSTDFENVTEITFVEKNNETTSKPDTAQKTETDCRCNILFRVCDISCCCDSDCLESEIGLFPNCETNKSKTNKQNDNVCLSQLSYFDHGNGLFCIVKTNLPEKVNQVYDKSEQLPTDHFFMWKSNWKSQILYEYSNRIYKYGDPVWLLKNGSIYHIDLPTQTINNYCTGRNAMQFLKDEKYSCIVKIKDLEMLQIIKNLEEVTVISATSLSMNSSVLNCTSLHCVNWTVTVCQNLGCTNYSKNLHEPTCTESLCMNIALKIDYIFYYQDSKIIKATIIFHIENKTLDIPFMSQEIQVKFVLANETIDNIIKLSGNPGYLDGLPIIVSYAEKNYTDAFYNKTMQKRYLLLPENRNGVCISINNSENVILFGINRRMNCRYNHKYKKLDNASQECKNIQNNINKLFEQNQAFVSPLGNPQQLKDTDWVSLNTSLIESTLYGSIQDRSSKLLCYNLITKYSLIIGFGFMNGNNRIVSCKYAASARNATFNKEDISTIVTVDISFIDVTKPSVINYITGHPNLNIHLPDDFFYPFRSNESCVFKCNVFTMIYFITIIISCK